MVVVTKEVETVGSDVLNTNLPPDRRPCMIQDLEPHDSFEPSFPLLCWASSNLCPRSFARVHGSRGQIALPVFSLENDALGFLRNNPAFSDHVLFSVTNSVMLCDLLDHVESVGFTHVVWYEVES